MPVPDYQSLMLPLLRFALDGEEHSLKQAVEDAVRVFKLSDSERQEMMPRGVQTKIYNRLTWARSHLGKAGLLTAAGNGRFKITPEGIRAAQQNSNGINVKVLQRYPAYIASVAAARGTFISKPAHPAAEAEDISKQTPQELLDRSFLELQTQLAQELLDRIGKCSPTFFERLVVDLLVAMGYGGSSKDAHQVIGKSGDEGIDGIIKEDRLGLDMIYVQAKRWKGTVGRPDVQGFAGSLDGHRARKGVFITTSQFSAEARDYVGKIEKKIILIDGSQLADLAIEYKVGVAESISYSVRRLDLDYFEEQ